MPDNSPLRLQPFKTKPHDSTSGVAAPGTELLQVIVETPGGSRHKYKFDEDDLLYRLHATLPAGMVFPFDFGFLPQTLGGDGDPLDVLVLAAEPTFPGCILLARLLGFMEVEQTSGTTTERNDRLIAVADTDHLYSAFHTVEDIPGHARTELEDFFTNYHRLQNKTSRTLAWRGTDPARQLITEAIDRYQRQH